MLYRWMYMLAGAALVLGVHAPARALELLTEENPPLNFMTEGRLTGIAPPVVEEMFRRANLQAPTRLLPWNEAFELARSKAGTCAYSTARTSERFPQFAWVGPIARGYWSAFSLPDAPVKVSKLADLAGYRVGVVNDARAAYLRERGIRDLVLAERDADLPARLTADPRAEGRIDVWVTQGLTAARVAAAAGTPKIREVFGSLMSQDYFLACGKQTPQEELRALNAALAEMRKDGTFNRIADQAGAAIRALR